jgi:phage shock protein A
MAHQAAEDRAVAMLSERIGVLEASGRKAIEGGRDDLAEEAAAEIAAAEDECAERGDAARQGRAEIARLRQSVEEGRRRLHALRRGLELARAQEALRRAGASGRSAIATGRSALQEAEATLARIRATHAREQDIGTALGELDGAAAGRDLEARLDRAGFGPNRKTKPADVMARLRAKPMGAITAVSG